jgi:hypothetical protein
MTNPSNPSARTLGAPLPTATATLHTSATPTKDRSTVPARPLPLEQTRFVSRPFMAVRPSQEEIPEEISTSLHAGRD